MTFTLPQLHQLLVVLLLLATASSNPLLESGGTGSRSQTSSQLDQIDPSAMLQSFNHILGQGALSHSDLDNAQRPCAENIPESAYAAQLLPRTHRHLGGDSCPFEYVTSTDENRIPVQMREAKCKCRYCDIPRHMTRRRFNPFKCLPIYHMVPVMRRGPADEPTNPNGGWTFALQRVSVGCTCRRTRRCRRQHS